MGNLNCKPTHLLTQSTKPNIMMLSALGFYAVKFCDKYPQEWTKQALFTLEDATAAYMVQVIAESDM